MYSCPSCGNEYATSDNPLMCQSVRKAIAKDARREAILAEIKVVALRNAGNRRFMQVAQSSREILNLLKRIENLDK